MNIIVIGGAGYIGCVVVNKLVNETKHNVFVFDNLSTGFKEMINPRAKFILGDQLDRQKLLDEFKKNNIDLVIALAAKIVVPESVEKPLEYFETNVQGLNNILWAMNQCKIDKIIFSSSAAVYGVPSKLPIDEDDIKNPCNPYGQSKLACEWLLSDAEKAYGIKSIVYRFFNVAGASNDGKYGMFKKEPSLLIPCINKALLENETIKIYGNNYDTKDGTCLRDYVHVEDLADAHILGISLLENQKKSSTFNLGSNDGATVLEVVETAMNKLKIDGKYVFFERRAGDPDKLLTSNKKAKEILNWFPKKTIEDMIVSDFNFRKTHIK